MAFQDVAAAIHRAQSVLGRRPQAGLHEDPPAVARWSGDTRVVTSHTNGTQFQTDMPTELGGTGGQVTPGWLMRAGLASCTATSIALAAAMESIELSRLEVVAASRSDTRGLLGMSEADGARIKAGPRRIELTVRICAAGVSGDRLRSLIEESDRRSPVACAMRDALPVDLRIEVIED
jgi:uncharacterized OsmC-like protein